MKKNVEIVEDENTEGVKLTRENVISIIKEHGTYFFITNYSVSEEFVLDNYGYFDKEAIIQGLNLSENFINKAIEIFYFVPEDITNLTMTTYSNLSSDFISKYKDNINWSRMVLYNSTQSDTFDDNYVEMIDNNNLWSLISSNDLPIDFIRKWKDKLDWKYLSMVKKFTEEEEVEFSDYILYKKFTGKDLKVDEIEAPEFGFGSHNYVDKLSQKELEDIIDNIYKEQNNLNKI